MEESNLFPNKRWFDRTWVKEFYQNDRLVSYQRLNDENSCKNESDYHEVSKQGEGLSPGVFITECRGFDVRENWRIVEDLGASQIL